MKRTTRKLGWAMAAMLSLGLPAAAKPGFGTISGVVLDPSGTPQMGATVWLISEDAGGRTVSQLLSNQRGAFFNDRLKPGQYSLRVSLPGFLPAMERHVAVMANLTTLLRVQVDSLFSSLDSLRRQPEASAEPDDWKWVLRSSAATRTVLQWRDGDVDPADTALTADSQQTHNPRALLQMTSGSQKPGFPSNLSDSPATAMSYDQRLGTLGRLLLAGQMSYERGASGAFATVWLPSGNLEDGPETTFTMREANVGLDNLMFQEMRADHSEQLALTDRVSLRAGAEFLRAGMLSATSAIHPHAQFDAKLSPNWSATLVATATPPSGQSQQTDALQSAMAQLDSLPTVLFRGGSPVFEGSWHQEVSVKHKVGANASIETAAFHDASRHQAIFGSGSATGPDFFQDGSTNAFLYDGGQTSSWGARAAYRQKISSNLDVTAVYSYAGALSPQGELNAASDDLRKSFVTRNRHSLAARASGKLPCTGTVFAAGYKWISGATLSRLDSYAEAMYQMEPGLHLSVRQPLPGFGPGGRWEALADFSNILDQGGVPLGGKESGTVLVPVMRSFRGGVSFQF
jgi:hypothetical protein